VGVGVNETGDEDGFGAVETMGRGVVFIDGRARVDGDDAMAADGHGSMFDDVVLSVHGDHVTGGPYLVGGLGGVAEENWPQINADQRRSEE
jgi:hypothetical protein